MDDSGLALWEVPRRSDTGAVPIDDTLLCPFGPDEAPSDITDPEFEAVLRRLLDC
jgi:hypothetical protein